MKVTIDNVEWYMVESQPGIIQFTQLDQYGHLVDRLEIAKQFVRRDFGIDAEQAVVNYIGTHAHLVQMLEDYGWVHQLSRPNVWRRRFTHSIIDITLNDTKWVAMDDTKNLSSGDGPTELYKFLNKDRR